MDVESLNLVDKLIVASASRRWQIIPERSVVRSHKPFKFWWAPTISLELLNLELTNLLKY